MLWVKSSIFATFKFNALCSFSSFSQNSLNTTINDRIRHGRLVDARTLFDENPQCRNVASWNSMLNGYVQNGQTRCARQMFDGMPERDVVSWNTMLVGFRRMGDTEQVVRLFFQMERTGVKPTEFTLTTVISAIPYDGFGVLVSQLHALVIQLAFGTNVFVATALVSGYAKLGDCISLRRVFDEIPVKGITLWNALISGYMNLRCVDEARLAFEAMPERNIVSWTSLVNGYVCNKMFDEAQSCFNKMPERNVISWTVMISAYEKNALNNIRTAATRLEIASNALHDLSLRPQGKKMLVPLTASLYVPGNLDDADKVLVDVGTGYFIEKTMEQGKDYCGRKINLLKSNYDELVEVAAKKKNMADEAGVILQAKLRQVASSP